MYATTHARNAEGRYVVRLPISRDLSDFSTRLAAMRSLTSMERRFARDRKLKAMYDEFMYQYLQLEHMFLAEKTRTGNHVCYLPQHGVLRECLNQASSGLQ